MVIAGFQALSLLDFPGKSCSIVFTQGCPFRCPYCHNPELIPMQPTSTVAEGTVLRYIADHRKMLDGVCITGGEPTVQVGLREFIEQVKNLGLLVKLDTNGIHPEFVRKLIADRLVDYFAMDLKQRWEKYQDVVRAGGDKTVANCQETFGIIQDSGVDHEFRTTVLPGSHTSDDFLAMAGYLHGGEKYFIQKTRFDKTLDANLPEESDLDVDQLLKTLRTLYPKLTIGLR